MRFLWRLTLIALLCGVGAPLTGCAVRGSSFETLGVPTPELRPGRSPIIVGWAREQREGWRITRIRVDEASRGEWNEESQEPAVFYLEPGEHQLQMSAEQLSDPRDSSSRARRRYRVRPIQLDLLEGEAQLCVIRLEGERRLRPRVRCEAHDTVDPEEDEYGDEYQDEDEYAEDEYEDDEYEDEEAAAMGEPARQSDEQPDTTQPPPASTSTSSSSGEVPSPFASSAAPPSARPTAPAAAPQPAPAAASATPPAPRPAPPPPTASSTQTPRRLTLEERVERVERQLEEIQRLLRERR